MKNWAIALLAANVLVAGYFLWPAPVTPPAAQALPGKAMSIISEQEWQQSVVGRVEPKLGASAPLAASAVQASLPKDTPVISASEPTFDPKPKPSAPEAKVVEPVWCAQSKPLASQSAAKLRGVLHAHVLKNQIKEQLQASSTRFWVYVPPHVSLQTAQLNLGIMQSKGVKDAFIMRDSDKWQYAISLGLYSTQAAAEQLKNTLEAKGIGAVRVKPQELVMFRLNDISKEKKRLLAEAPLTWNVCKN